MTNKAYSSVDSVCLYVSAFVRVISKAFSIVSQGYRAHCPQFSIFFSIQHSRTLYSHGSVNVSQPEQTSVSGGSMCLRHPSCFHKIAMSRSLSSFLVTVAIYRGQKPQSSPQHPSFLVNLPHVSHNIVGTIYVLFHFGCGVS